MDTGDNGLCSILQEKKMWNGENASNRQATGGCKDRCLVCSVCNKFSSKKVNVMQHLLANHNAGNELLGGAELSPNVPSLARKPFDYLRTLTEARCAQNLRQIEKVTFMSDSFALKENCNDLKHGNLAEMLEQYAARQDANESFTARSPTLEKQQQQYAPTLSCPLCAEAFLDQATVETHVLRVHNIKMDGLNRLLKLVDTSQFLKTTNGKQQPTSNSSSPVEKPGSPHSPAGGAKEGSVSPGVPSIRCSYCKAPFDTMVDLKIHCNESSHFRRSADSDDLACFLHDCKDAFDNLADLNQHFKASHLNFLISEHHTYRYRCKQCPFAFKTHEKLSRHLFYHSLRESTKCFYCDHHFKNIHSLTAHIAEKHPQEALQSGKPSPPGIASPDASILFFKDLKRKMLNNQQQQQQRNGLSPRSDRSGGRDARDSVDEDRLSEKSVSSKSSSFYYDKSLDGSGTSEGRYTCTDCQFTFTDSGALERHLATACHMPRDDKASPDSLAASLMSSLAKHHQQQQQQQQQVQQQQQQSQHNQQSLTTTSSSSSSNTQMSSLFYDIKSEKFTNPNRPFKCTICMESFTQKNILLVHYNSVSHLNKLKKLKAEKGFAQMFTGSLLGADIGGTADGCTDRGKNSPSPTVPFGEKAATPFSMPSFAEGCAGGATSGGGGGEKRKEVGDEKESARKKFKCDICNVAYTQGSTLDIHMRSVLHQTRACRLQERSLFTGQSNTAQQQQAQQSSPQGGEGKKKSEFPLIHPIPESHDQSPNMLDEVSMRKLKSPSEQAQQQQQQQQQQQLHQQQALGPLFCGVPVGGGGPDKPEICVCECCYQVFPGKLMLETHLELSPECLTHRKKLLDNAAGLPDQGGPLGFPTDGGFQHHQALSELAKVNALTGGFDLGAPGEAAALLGAKSLVPTMDPAATAAAAAAAANLMDPSFLKNASLLQFAATDPTSKLNPNALNVLNFMHFHHLMSLSYLNLAPQLSFGGVPPKVGAGDPTKPDGSPGTGGLGDPGTKGGKASSGASVVLPPVSLNGKPLDLNLLPHGLDPKLAAQSPQQLGQQPGLGQQQAQQQQQQPCTQKRARTRITDEQLRILRSHFDINNSPSEESIQEMSLKANLPQKVVKHWFRNTLFKERQRNKDSPYNFSIPPSTKLNVEEYERTGEAKVTDLETSFKSSTDVGGSLSQENSCSQGSTDMSKALNEAMKQNLSKSLLESLSKHQSATGQDLVGAAAAFHLNKSLFPDTFGGGGGGGGGVGGVVGGPDFSGADTVVGSVSDYFQRAAADAVALGAAVGGGPGSVGGPLSLSMGGTGVGGGGNGGSIVTGNGGGGGGGNGGGGGGKKKKIKSESSNDSPTPADLQLDSSNSSPMPMRPPSAISLKKHMATPPTLVVGEEMKIPSPIESPVISPPGSMGLHALPPQTQPITCSNGKRANRTRFTDYQIKVLQEFFENNSYPKDSDLEYLSKLLMLSPRVIVVWFQNARQKQRKIYENQPNPTFESDEKKAININYTCKKCNLVFQRYYELIRHQKNHCFKEESNKRSAKAQLAAAQIAHSFTSGSEDSDSSLDVSRREFQPRENDCPF
uniref:Zinc finger protein 2 n=1 Tax=Anopheles culicifacies TaxID=139723 RepID=A0A182MJD5_9DIPT